MNIIFDIGNVLVNLDVERAFKRLAKNINPLTAMLIWAKKDEFLKEIRKEQDLLETGRMTIHQFYSRLKGKIGLKIDFELFEEAWCDMFDLNQEVIDFARELSENHNIFFASNTNESHIKFLQKSYPEIFFVKGMGLSYELESLKPKKEFFNKLLEKFELTPDSCLFIDDLQKNVDGARDLGIQSILFKDLDQLKSDLAKMVI